MIKQWVSLLQQSGVFVDPTAQHHWPPGRNKGRRRGRRRRKLYALVIFPKHRARLTGFESSHRSCGGRGHTNIFKAQVGRLQAVRYIHGMVCSYVAHQARPVEMFAKIMASLLTSKRCIPSPNTAQQSHSSRAPSRRRSRPSLPSFLMYVSMSLRSHKNTAGNAWSCFISLYLFEVLPDREPLLFAGQSSSSLPRANPAGFYLFRRYVLPLNIG